MFDIDSTCSSRKLHQILGPKSCSLTLKRYVQWNIKEVVFNLGNGFKVERCNNAMKVARFVLQREYTKVSNNSLMSAQFIPEKLGGVRLPGKQLKTKLKNLFGNFDSRDIVVFYDLGFLSKTVREENIDFLIFSWTRKLIIPIEIRTELGSTDDYKGSSMTRSDDCQINRPKANLEELFCAFIDQEWQLCPSIYVCDTKLNKNDSICCDHIKWIISDEYIDKWWANIQLHFPEIQNKSGHEDARQQTLDMVSLLLFIRHVYNVPITTSKTDENIVVQMDSIGSEEEIIFWSKDQMSLLQEENEKLNYIMFKSGYGTGKSIVMRQKAENLAKSGYRCLFVVGGSRVSKRNTLLHLKLQERWTGTGRDENIVLRSLYDIMVRTFTN